MGRATLSQTSAWNKAILATNIGVEAMATAELAGVIVVHVLVADDARSLVVVLHHGLDGRWSYGNGWEGVLVWLLWKSVCVYK